MFHGQRSTRINILHYCSVLYFCFFFAPAASFSFSYLLPLQFLVPSNKRNKIEHSPIEHSERESNICCVITYLCSNFLFLTSLLSRLVHLVKPIGMMGYRQFCLEST
jgi:hypothetical protein